MAKKITCGILLINPSNEILLCGVTNSSNLWSIPKGIKEDNETELQAAIRELYEETGIKLDQSANKIADCGEIDYNNGKKTLRMFLTKCDHINIDSLFCESYFTNSFGERQPEVDKYKWVSFDEFKNMAHYTQANLFDDYMWHNKGSI